MRPCLLREAHVTWMCSGFWPCPQGPVQCGGPHSFGIRSPRLTVPEVLTYPSAKRGQPPLLKACSWTNLQRHHPHLVPCQPRAKREPKTTEKLVSLSQVEPRTSCFPHPLTSQGPSLPNVSPFPLHMPPSSAHLCKVKGAAGSLSSFHRG